MQNSSNDWAYLERFSAENDFLKVQLNENRVVFIGDSIIAGWSTNCLFLKNKQYINRGINGQTTAQILHRFTQDVIDLKPRHVLILVGTNDIAENNGTVTLTEMENNYLAMISIARKNNIKVVLGSLLPASAYYWNKKISKPIEKIKIVNQFLNKLADNETIFFIDFYSHLVDQDAMASIYSADGVHPNEEGYRLMSEILKNENHF